MLCGSKHCRCALTSNSLQVSGSGSGDDPWMVELPGGATRGNYYSFATTAERSAQLPVPAEGDLSYLRDIDQLQWWDSDEAAWINVVGDVLVFNPAFTATTTNPSLGTTGTSEGWYSRQGDLVFFEFVLTFGGTGMSQGSGTYNISLPVPPKSPTNSLHSTRGTVVFRDSSAGTQRDYKLTISGGLLFINAYNDTALGGSGALTAAAAPFTYAASDFIAGQVVYHAA